ncbi:unnamed protein product [Boreogadus saida]
MVQLVAPGLEVFLRLQRRLTLSARKATKQKKGVFQSANKIFVTPLEHPHGARPGMLLDAHITCLHAAQSPSSLEPLVLSSLEGRGGDDDHNWEETSKGSNRVRAEERKRRRRMKDG